MIDSEALRVTRQVTAVLDALGVPYVIGGSLASIVHGQGRMTMDADIVAGLSPDHAAALTAALGEAFYVPDEATLRQAIARRGSFNLIHLATMFKVDVFLPQGRPFDQQQMARRIGQPVGGETLWLLSAEDVILSKLAWFRAGGEGLRLRVRREENGSEAQRKCCHDRRQGSASKALRHGQR